MCKALRCNLDKELGKFPENVTARESSVIGPAQCSSEPQESVDNAASIDSEEAGRVTVLIADDEPGILGLVGEVLRDQGYTVMQAADGLEALELAAEHPGAIHVLLTDVSMPRLGGGELHRRLSHERPETRTLFMSGSVDNGLQPDSAFLPKPFTPSDLVRKVGEVLGVNGGHRCPK